MSDPAPNLRPHSPLDPGDQHYVVRADGAERIVAALALAPVVGVVGPTGVGKSTELAAAVHLLRGAGRAALHAPLDRHANMRTMTVDLLHVGLAAAVRGRPERTSSRGFRDDLLILLRGLPGPNRPVLVVDGLEKVTDPERGRDLLDALGDLAADADIIGVLPWYAAYGPQAGRVIGDQERVVSLRALAMPDGVGFLRGLYFRRDVSQRYLARGFPEDFSWLDEAAKASGGVPRTFLQLVADTLVYGGNEQGLNKAIRDQQDSLRRALLPDDAEAIQTSQGTDGREIDLDRRIRLLASGMLLERELDGRIVVEPAPLVRGLLG